jgi:hypothetical protein
MADIRLTLSTDPKTRSPGVAEEARWIAEEGAIYYELSSRPLRARPGCWVYFIRAGQLAARARANDFLWMDAEDMGGTYSGVLEGQSCWRVKVVPPMELAKHPIAHKGFQGFRYVTEDEQATFEAAFDV